MENDIRSENWKAIPGFEGLYEASDLGRIRSLDRTTIFRGKHGLTERKTRGVILKFISHTSEYPRISLWKNGVMFQFYAHALVLLTFRGPRPVGQQVCHENGNPKDNRLENLRWDTPSANQADREFHGTGRFGVPRKRGNKKIGSERAEDIRQIYAELGNITQTAILLGLARTTVADVINRRTWK